MKIFLLLIPLIIACGQTPAGLVGVPGPQGPQGVPGQPGAAGSPAPTASPGLTLRSLVCSGDDADDAYLITYSVTNGEADIVVSSGECGFSLDTSIPGHYHYQECRIYFDGATVVCDVEPQ